MRVVIDTNIIVSALAFPASLPGEVLQLWREDRFALVTGDEHLAEIRRVTRYPKLRQKLSPPVVGALVNEIRNIAHYVHDLARLDVSSDPFDNYLLALAQAGQANFLVTGDKTGLLSLERFDTARIVTARQFLESL